MPTWNNLNPLANPFNSRQMPNATFSRGPTGNPKDLTVPESRPVEFRSASELTVPNQDVPLGDRLTGNGFVTNEIFRLSDGTLIDWKSRKILAKSPQLPGEWAPVKTYSMSDPIGEHPHETNIDDMIAHPEKYMYGPNEIESGMSPEDAAYWLKAEEEAEKLKAGMSDEQRRMIADFEAHFPKSRLIEESMKAR